MDRETRTIIAPSGKELVIKTYLTARERNAIRDVFLKSAKINVGVDTNEKGMNLDGTVMTESQNKLLQTVIVKYGEQTNPDAILNNLLDASPEEYDYAISECEKINGNLTQAK